MRSAWCVSASGRHLAGQRGTPLTLCVGRARLERPRGHSGGLPGPPGRALRRRRHFTLPSHFSDSGPADSVCVTAGPGDVGTVPSARAAASPEVACWRPVSTLDCSLSGQVKTAGSVRLPISPFTRRSGRDGCCLPPSLRLKTALPAPFVFRPSAAMQPLQLSDEILLLALLPLCPLPCVLQLAAVARRTGPGQLTTHDLLRRCVDLRERVLTALLPVLWEGLRCPPFRGVCVPLLQFGGHHSGDFAHAVRAGMWSARFPATLLRRIHRARASPPYTARRPDLPR